MHCDVLAIALSMPTVIIPILAGLPGPIAGLPGPIAGLLGPIAGLPGPDR